MSGIDTSDQISLVSETIEISKRDVERGSVIVRTRVDEREEMAEVELRHDDVEVERVPINREVATAPTVREEDGVLIVPVLEEELVVSTRLVLKEEIRIVPHSRLETFRQPVRLRSEHAEILRVEEAHQDQPKSEGYPK